MNLKDSVMDHSYKWKSTAFACDGLPMPATSKEYSYILSPSWATHSLHEVIIRQKVVRATHNTIFPDLLSNSRNAKTHRWMFVSMFSLP